LDTASDGRITRCRCGPIGQQAPKPIPHVIHIESPDVSKRGSIIMLELADEHEAIRMAQRIAFETGRRVTVRDAQMALIETIPAASVH
jgi:hypothetical protein